MLLHEGAGCVALWRDVPQALAATTGCGVLVYSRAGYGGSSPCALPRPLRYMEDHALEVLPPLLAQLDARALVLVGHSDGGSIAAVHAGARPDPRLAGVVLLAPHFFAEPISVAAIRRATRASKRTTCVSGSPSTTRTTSTARSGAGPTRGCTPTSCAGTCALSCRRSERRRS